MIHKAQRNRPLTSAQKRTNHRWAKTRARVEHVFARIDLFRKGRLLRCTGLARTTVVIGLINFAHNLRRLGRWRGCAAAGAREWMRSEHRERAPETGQNEVQNVAKDNRSDPLTDAPRHAIDQAACGEFKTGFSNCSDAGPRTAGLVVSAGLERSRRKT